MDFVIPSQVSWAVFESRQAQKREDQGWAASESQLYIQNEFFLNLEMPGLHTALAIFQYISISNVIAD